MAPFMKSLKNFKKYIIKVKSSILSNSQCELNENMKYKSNLLIRNCIYLVHWNIVWMWEI